MTPIGAYAPIVPVQSDIICSAVLPDFQFRISDLQRQPSPEEMSEDSVYRAFMLPALQAARQTQQLLERLLEVAESQVQQEREARLQEQEARRVAEQSAQQEREARLAAEARLQQLEAELALRR